MGIKLTKDLLTDEAEKVAQELVTKRINKNQLRKFYNDFLSLQNKAYMLQEDDFKDTIIPLIQFSKAKLAYACGRNNIPKYFFITFSSYISNIESKEDFTNFMNFYQAVIGYFTYYSQIKSESIGVQNKLSRR